MADFIITTRPEPDASRDVDWLRRYQVPAMAVPVMRTEQQPFDAARCAAVSSHYFYQPPRGCCNYRLTRQGHAWLCDYCRYMRWDAAPHWPLGKLDLNFVKTGPQRWQRIGAISDGQSQSKCG